MINYATLLTQEQVERTHAASLEILENIGLLVRNEKARSIFNLHGCRMDAGIQIVKPGTRTPDAATALRINEKCFQKGLLMFAPVGVAGECIKIAPTLDTTRDALLEGIAVLREAMDEVLR